MRAGDLAWGPSAQAVTGHLNHTPCGFAVTAPCESDVAMLSGTSCRLPRTLRHPVFKCRAPAALCPVCPPFWTGLCHVQARPAWGAWGNSRCWGDFSILTQVALPWADAVWGGAPAGWSAWPLLIPKGTRAGE